MTDDVALLIASLSSFDLDESCRIEALSTLAGTVLRLNTDLVLAAALLKRAARNFAELDPALTDEMWSVAKRLGGTL